MFERYTERARRVIFFGRYEASQFGSTTIESEHLLLGLLREDKNLICHFLREVSTIETIRAEIRKSATIREKTATSIDLPLTDECKRILAYAADEAERLNHRHIGSEHLVLGIMREEKCLAATILLERGLRLHEMREEVARSGAEGQMSRGSAPTASIFNESAETGGMAKIVLRLIHKRFGDVPAQLQERVMSLPRKKVETLADSLLDLTGIGDLELWLNEND